MSQRRNPGKPKMTKRDHQRARPPQKVTRSPQRDGVGGDQVEGRQAVRELLKAGRRRVHEIYFDQAIERVGIVAEIATLALQRRVPLKEVSSSKFDLMCRSESSQGVIALAEPLRYLDLESIFSIDSHRKIKRFVVLDHITDPRNLGAILRSAECAGFDNVVLPERRSTKITPTVAKTSAGAIEYLNFALVPGVASALEELKKRDVWSIGLSPDATDSLWDVDLLDSSVALVLGAEGKGLSRLVQQRCDYLVAIPQVGSIGSLNVSAAAAVAMFTISRK